MNTVAGLGGLAFVFAAVAALLFAAVLGRKARTYAYQPRKLQTDAETEFFERLLMALPGEHIYPQVAMSALIEPAGGSVRLRLEAFRKISQKRVDYVVCDAKHSVVCVVELDDRTHKMARDRLRDALLKSAGIATLRWEARRMPASHEIRAVLAPLVQRKRVRQ